VLATNILLLDLWREDQRSKSCIKKGWVDGLKERLIEGACLAQNL